MSHKTFHSQKALKTVFQNAKKSFCDNVLLRGAPPPPPRPRGNFWVVEEKKKKKIK
jgi:hypothetical protein